RRSSDLPVPRPSPARASNRTPSVPSPGVVGPLDTAPSSATDGIPGPRSPSTDPGPPASAWPPRSLPDTSETLGWLSGTLAGPSPRPPRLSSRSGDTPGRTSGSASTDTASRPSAPATPSDRCPTGPSTDPSPDCNPAPWSRRSVDSPSSTPSCSTSNSSIRSINEYSPSICLICYQNSITYLPFRLSLPHLTRHV